MELRRFTSSLREFFCGNRERRYYFDPGGVLVGRRTFFTSLILPFLLARKRLMAATGDITAVRIVSGSETTHAACGASANGWVAEIDIAGLSAAGPTAFQLGMGASNSPAAATVVLTVTSPGYDATGTATTITRTVYGTYWLRKPYPSQASADEAATGGTLTVRVALSDFVYSGDTVTATIVSGFYTGSLGASAVATTINSTQAYPTSICRWAWPVQYSAVTGNFTLEAVCFNRFARNGKPLAAVKFTVIDEHSNTAGPYVATAMTKSTADAGDQYTVLAYQATVDVSTLTQGDTLTANLKAYPWVGDSGAVFDSNSGVTQPNERVSDLLLLNDKAGTYSGAFAVVDPTGGGLASNATTKVYASRALAEAAYASSATNSYTTAGYAFDALKGWNNANATPTHNDPGGGTILLVGAYNYTSTGRWAAGVAQKTWVSVSRLSTVAKSSAIWTDTGSSNVRVLRLKFDDITISGAGVILADDATTGNALWLHDLAINVTADGSISGYAAAYATKNIVTALRNGFTNTGVTKSPWPLIRGNVMPESLSTPAGTRLADLYCLLGNKNIILKTRESNDGAGEYRSSNSIAAFNGSFKLNAPWYNGQIGGTAPLPITDVAIVQNVVEVNDNSTQQPLLAAAADNSTEDGNNNFLLWHTTYVGARVNLAYNDGNPIPAQGGTGTVTFPLYRWNWSVKHNLFDDVNIVTDIDTHAGNTPNAYKTGNWATWFGVGLSGNSFANRGVAATNTYSPIFDGILGHRGNNENPNYLHDYSHSGTGAGNGDYHPTVTSPFLNLARSGEAVLPYDLDGVSRRNDGTGAAGAYEYAPPAASSGIPAVVIW